MYVHDVSPVKTSRRNSNVAYFNMKLQAEDKNYREISYRMDLKEAFDSAMEHKSPVKITTVVTRPNKFSNELMDLEVTKDSNVEPTDASFESKPMTVQSVDVTVKEIKGGNHVNQLVNVKGYLTVEDRPTTLITTKYSVEPILMKTAIINDENDNMFVELWGSFATNVTTNGSYV